MSHSPATLMATTSEHGGQHADGAGDLDHHEELDDRHTISTINAKPRHQPTGDAFGPFGEGLRRGRP